MIHLERRVARLEAAQSSADGLIELKLGDEEKELLRSTLAGLYPSEEIERIASAKRLSPRRKLSPDAREQLGEVVAALT